MITVKPQNRKTAKPISEQVRNLRNLKYLILSILVLCAAQKSAAQTDGFYVTPISDSLFNYMNGKSYKTGCPVGRNDLRHVHVLHYDGDSNVCKGEMVCNKLIATKLVDIFRSLYKAKYPIQCIRLVDEFEADDEKSMTANNSSCFNFRNVAGTKVLSLHAKGLAIDINPLYNPCVKTTKGKTIIEPVKGKDYADRKKNFPYKIDENDLCYKLFIRHGFHWGGAWRSIKDYQHFEFVP